MTAALAVLGGTAGRKRAGRDLHHRFIAFSAQMYVCVCVCVWRAAHVLSRTRCTHGHGKSRLAVRCLCNTPVIEIQDPRVAWRGFKLDKGVAAACPQEIRTYVERDDCTPGHAHGEGGLLALRLHCSEARGCGARGHDWANSTKVRQLRQTGNRWPSASVTCNRKHKNADGPGG